jgi:hypothetical protein
MLPADDKSSDPTFTQGDLSSLDSQTGQEAGQLSQQMVGGPGMAAQAPIVWGSIRVFAVYGKWSFWRKPKKTV